MENTEKNGVGAIVGIIIIIILILAGGWYFISQRIDKIDKQNTEAVPESEFSTSTEVADIQADLGKIDTKVMDQE